MLLRGFSIFVLLVFYLLFEIPMGRREFKPVENTNVFDEAGRLHPLGCN